MQSGLDRIMIMRDARGHIMSPAAVRLVAAAPRGKPVPRPLAVDLDGTLVATDTLHETLTTIAFRHPHRLPRVLLTLGRGRASFKRAACDTAQIDFEALPFDPAVMQLITERRAAGGEVHLVTAADQRIADGVAAATGLFDSATGTSDAMNLRGAAKAELLKSRFPGGFDYIGDSRADFAVWRQANAAIVAGGRSRLSARLARDGFEAQILPRAHARTRTWIKALRLHQWSKNALIFVPLILAHEFSQTALLFKVTAAWVLFGLVASATYLINDLSDLSADRRHPTKRFRAVASGLVRISVAGPLALLMLCCGLAGAWWLDDAFGVTASVYVALTLAYSLRLKREPLVDVTVIAALFAVRIVAGMVVVAHPVSLWLATFTMTLFLSLALAKRTAELVRSAQRGCAVAGRGYLPGDEPLTLALGIAAGMVSVLVMVLYMSIEAMPTGLYQNQGPLFVIPVVLGMWIMRMWLRAHRGVLDDDPVVYAIRDRGSWVHAGAVIALYAAASV